MAGRDKMRTDNSNRIRKNNDFNNKSKDNFKENAQKIAKMICNPNKHFMNEYLTDLLIIIHEKGEITESGLQQELMKRRNTSKLATMQFIYSIADPVKQWLNFNATSEEKDNIKKNGAASILKLLVEHIEKI